MKYMLLMQGPASGMKQFGQMPVEDIRAHIEFMKTVNAELRAAGELVDAQGLTPPNETKIVRNQGGKMTVTDGPFPESKEFLAGYWVVDVKSEQRVLEIATRISGAPGRGGAPMSIPVEVRPVGEAPKV